MLCFMSQLDVEFLCFARKTAREKLGTTACPLSTRSPRYALSQGYGQRDRRATREFRDDSYIATHGFDRFPQRREEQIAPFFPPRNAVLGDTKPLRDARLR